MSSYSCARACALGLFSVVVAGAFALAGAAEPEHRPAAPQFEDVEVFAGIERGQIKVELIPRDSKRCRLLITNQTDKPLSVRLPQSFAAVPVLAQANWPNFNAPNNSADAAPQRLGMGPGMGRMGALNPLMNIGINGNLNGNRNGFNQGNQNGWQGFMFNILPEKVGRMRLASVCLDHGHPNPQPQIKYEIKPIDAVAAKPAVAEICGMLGRGELDQRVAQLAAWHLNNDVSWKELGRQRQLHTLVSRPVYTPAEIRAAKEAVEKAVEKTKPRSPSTSNAGGDLACGG